MLKLFFISVLTSNKQGGGCYRCEYDVWMTFVFCEILLSVAYSRNKMIRRLLRSTKSVHSSTIIFFVHKASERIEDLDDESRRSRYDKIIMTKIHSTTRTKQIVVATVMSTMMTP